MDEQSRRYEDQIVLSPVELAAKDATSPTSINDGHATMVRGYLWNRLPRIAGKEAQVKDYLATSSSIQRTALMPY